MKLYRLFATTSMALLLGACGATPSCDAGDTLNLLGEIVEETFQKSLYGQALRPQAEFRFRNIRMLRHRTDTDTYHCSASLEISVDGIKPVVQELEYEVYPVTDEDGDFAVNYDERDFIMAISDAALRKSLHR